MSNSAIPAAGAPGPIVWQWARLHELAAAEVYAVLAARQRVFVIEQSCAYLDADGLDAYAWHLIGWPAPDARREPAAYLRVVDPGHRFAEPSIGRVLTAAGYRRIGLGYVLMREGLARTQSLYPGQAIRIAAQLRLEGFYQRLGFGTVSAVFNEDGIPHVEMLLGGAERASPARPEASRQFR